METPPHLMLVGYFPQWGIYNQPQYFLSDLVHSGGATLLDQLNYAQGYVDGGRCSIADPNADLNYAFTAQTSVNGKPDSQSVPFRGGFHQLEELKQRYPHLKILISLAGNAKFFAADAQPERRQAFVASCIRLFLQGEFASGMTRPGLFDGFDIDWEYPKQADAENYVALLGEFRKQMDAYRPGLRLTVAMGPSPHMYPGVDMQRVSEFVDEIGMMNYDYAGPWSKTTGIIAPLYKDTNDPREGGSVDSTLAQYQAAGVSASKLLMGIPFYGYGWKNVASTQHGLFQPGQAIPDDHPYSYIASLIKSSNSYRDPTSHAPWLYDGNSFWTYEDAISIGYKMDYAKQQGLRGVMIWELSGDQPDGTLLKAAARERLRNPNS